MKRTLKCATTAMLITLALLAAMTPTPASGQKGTIIRKRIQFARGKSTMTVRGNATWGTVYAYSLRASAGQTMTVRVRGKADFQIYPPGARPNADTTPEEIALEGAVGVKQWSGELPTTGNYEIWLNMSEMYAESVPYTLEVTIR